MMDNKDKKRDIVGWIIKHELVSAYTILLSLILAFYMYAFILIFSIVAWWERIR